MSEFFQILFDDMSMASFFAYFTIALFGFLGSILFDIYSSGISLKEFCIKKWWERNQLRVLLSLFVIATGIFFSEEILGITLSTWSSFLAGFTSDKIIENMMKRRVKKKANKPFVD